MPESKEYYSCRYIEDNIVFGYDNISFCCINSQLSIPSNEFSVEKFIEYKKAVIEKNQTEDQNKKCKTCGWFKKQSWSQNDYLINNIVIYNVQKCHLRCSYCYRSDQGYKEKIPTELYDVYPIIQSFVDDKILSPNTQIDWSGGEPTLMKNFEKIVRLFLDYGNIAQGINTNGVVLSPLILELLNSRRGGVVCSVDSGTPETYSLIKNRNFSDRVWQNLAEYAKTGGDVRVKYIVLPENMDEITQFLDKTQESNINMLLYDINGRLAGKPGYLDNAVNAIVSLVVECQKRGITTFPSTVGLGIFSDVKTKIDNILRDEHGL